ncbi:MAG: hypothetical protein M3O71_12075 [Bacteroidota bacterium]|nr:hypothetical protein [Bacteroidota bacterium]
MSDSNICDSNRLAEEQILMLQLSDKDIQAGRLISHEQLDRDDLKWLEDGEVWA